MNASTLVQKLWNYCNVLRDDGMGYGDYVEQLTFLLFLKMADERTQPPYRQKSIVPAAYAWPTLVAQDGDELFDHYRHVLEALGQQKGTLGLIFGKAQNKFQDPAKLRRVIVDLIDKENWSALGVDVKGDAYEGLLEKNAQDLKSGAGQYFTPRALIQAMVDCIAPKPDEYVCDPACGTGGFLFTAYNYVIAHHPNLTRAQKQHLREGAFTGVELVQATARVCAMNLLLHGIGSETSVPVQVTDALASDPGARYDVVLANPPFGKKSSTMIVGEDGRTTSEKEIIERDDFWATTSNKQLNFVQHIKTLLDIHGRAAVVVPDNVLFEGGAGETIRRKLLHECELHTLLRLPTGLFYAQGVKANVLFFDKKPASETPWTKTLWIYDLRTNQHFTLKTDPLKREDLDEFVACYHPANRHARTPTWSTDTPDGRWRAYRYDELIARDKASLDIFWLRDDSLAESDNLPAPEVIAQEIVDDLEAALEQFRLIAADLGGRGSALED
ncbi:MAG: type I restriction-modification system subunit M [Metallibacterium scheffleri]|jgi:type I restriction enzyme M protein|uniref:type I restriction-modification system subunit M n=1 Tax=Metallibacterium scheffleri TaxID=993689 RepID=UPI0026ED8907|nr:class I SAM-dependent DNA methyltransferase [Metallibacterium scheffleri]MCK9368052.1 type I restriction-modification system subunit M [Metallibacterium scheffleri]